MAVPPWLTILAILSLSTAALCLLDTLSGHCQPMIIMNVAWPVSALYGGPLALWLYLRTGRPDAVAGHPLAKPH